MNPYESPANIENIPAPVTPEDVWRVRFVVSMWVCGYVGMNCMPTFVGPSLKHENLINHGIHFAWLTPFFCSVASVSCAIGLFRLSRIADKIGAIMAIMMVGIWPGLFAVYWWIFFLTVR